MTFYVSYSKMRGLFILLVLLNVGNPVWGQRMKDVFVSLPDTIVPLLSKVNKEDCIDFLDNNMRAEVKNRLNGKSELLQLTDDYFKLQVTAINTLQGKLLAMSDSTKLICLINTVVSGGTDSRIAFYTTNWRRLDAENYIMLPLLKDFLLPQNVENDSISELLGYANMLQVEMTLSPSDSSLRISYTGAEYVNKEKREQYTACFRQDSVLYEWREDKFSIK